MSWEAIGTIAELVGATAVVVSLIYLAAQIRYNTKELDERNRSYQLTSLNEVANRYTVFRAKVIDDETLASIWARGREDLDVLNPTERLRFDYLAVEMFWCWGMLYLYSQQKVMDARVMELSLANLRLYADGNGIRTWWQVSPHRLEFPPDFTAEVDRQFSAGGVTSESAQSP